MGWAMDSNGVPTTSSAVASKGLLMPLGGYKGSGLGMMVEILCAVLAGFAIIAGVAFGGIRILMKRLYPNRVFDRPEQMEFISLHLAEATSTGASAERPGGMNQGPKSPAGAS